MRTFENFPENSICPVCKKNTNKECFLVPIDGTGEGNISEATIVHKDCAIEIVLGNFRHNKEHGIFYYFIP